MTTCQGNFPWVEGTYQCWSDIYFWLSINHGINHGIGCPDCQAWIEKKTRNTLHGRAFLLWYTCHVRISIGVVFCKVARCTRGHISSTHNNAWHQCLRLEVRKLGYTFCLRVVDVRNVVLQVFAMMMESASNIAIERITIFSFMMGNPSINAMDRNTRFVFKVFYFWLKATITLVLK